MATRTAQLALLVNKLMSASQTIPPVLACMSADVELASFFSLPDCRLLLYRRFLFYFAVRFHPFHSQNIMAMLLDILGTNTGNWHALTDSIMNQALSASSNRL